MLELCCLALPFEQGDEEMAVKNSKRALPSGQEVKSHTGSGSLFGSCTGSRYNGMVLEQRDMALDQLREAEDEIRRLKNEQLFSAMKLEETRKEINFLKARQEQIENALDGGMSVFWDGPRESNHEDEEESPDEGPE